MEDSKKKIGILTYLYAVNHGSLHQANSILRYCQNSYPDYDVRFINLAPRRGVLKELRNNLVNRRFISGVLIVFRFYRELTRFPYFGKLLITDNLKKSVRYIEDLKLDIVIVGSDTVWENRMKRKGYASPPPNIYFYSEYQYSKCVSFSASSDRSLPEYWTKATREIIAHQLRKFHWISVRDAFTKELLEAWDDSLKINLVGDPTFLVNHDYIYSFVYKPLLSKRFAVLDISDRKLSQEVANILKQNGLIVVAPMANRYADYNLRGKIDYRQWAWLHMKAEVAITNRFHGTIFSIFGGTQFISVDDSPEYSMGANSKKFDLLKRLNLLKNYSNGNDLIEKLNELCSQGRTDYNYQIFKEEWEKAINQLKL